MKKLKAWLEKTGIENFGLVVAALAIWFFLGWNMFITIGGYLLSAFVALNWQALKDLSTLDEKVEEKFEDVKEFLKEELDDIKRKLVGLKSK